MGQVFCILCMVIHPNRFVYGHRLAKTVGWYVHMLTLINKETHCLSINPSRLCGNLGSSMIFKFANLKSDFYSSAQNHNYCSLLQRL